MPGVANGRAVLTPRQIETIRGLYSTGRYTQQQLAQHFGVVQPHISRIIRLEQWT
jgi:DNA-binding MarR family transcriptional regulator